MTTAWVIEMNGVLLCYSKDGSCLRWVTFTDKDAWLFETKDAAQSVILKRCLPASAVEHGWAD